MNHISYGTGFNATYLEKSTPSFVPPILRPPYNWIFCKARIRQSRAQRSSEGGRGHYLSASGIISVAVSLTDRKWSKGEIFAVVGTILALGGVVATIATPELRRMAGLEARPVSTTQNDLPAVREPPPPKRRQPRTKSLPSHNNNGAPGWEAASPGTKTAPEAGALTLAAPAPAPTHTPARPLNCFSPTSGKDGDYFDVQLCECTRPQTSDHVSCSGFVTNTRRDSKGLWAADSLATDNDEGTAFQIPSNFWVDGGFGFCGNNGNVADLAPDTRTKFCMWFRDSNPNVATFNFTVKFHRDEDNAVWPTYYFTKIPLISVH
jgi:hypothetical protein